MRRTFLFLLLLAGCKVVDQTTFGAKPVAPPPDLLTQALRSNSTVPLVVIRFNGGEGAYVDQLRMAVLMAEARRPDAQYDVVTVVPTTGDPAKDAQTATAGQADAAAVGDLMENLGVEPTRIRLSARTEPEAKMRELRVYVH